MSSATIEYCNYITSILYEISGLMSDHNPEEAPLRKRVQDAYRLLIHDPVGQSSIDEINKTVKEVTQVAEQGLVSEKVMVLFNKLKLAEAEEELKFYLLYPKKGKTEADRNRLKEIVRNFDLNKLISLRMGEKGDILAMHLSRSSSPFLRSLIPICIERGQDPGFINSYGESLFHGLVERNDDKVALQIAEKMEGEFLKKCLLSEGRRPITFEDDTSALERSSNFSLLVQLMNLGGVSVQEFPQLSSEFYEFVKKSVKNSDLTIDKSVDIFFEKYLDKIALYKRKKAFLYLLEKQDLSNPIFIYMLEKSAPSIRQRTREWLMDWVGEVLSSGRRIDEHEWVILTLLDKGLFPLLTRDGKLMISGKRKDKISSHDEIEPAMGNYFSENALLKCRGILPSLKTLHAFKDSLDFFALKELVVKLTLFINDEEFSIREEKNKGFRPFLKETRELLDNLDKEISTREKRVVSWLEDYDARRTGMPTEISLDLIIYLIRNGRWKILSEWGRHVFRPQHFVDSGITGFLLDKVIVNPEFRNLAWSLRYQEALRLQNSLEEYIQHIPQDSFIPSEKKFVVQKTLSSASKALFLMAMAPRNSDGSPDAQKAAALAFQAYSNGESPVLISTGFDPHTIVLALYKGDKSTKAVLFNTGAGIKAHHARGKDPSKFQTHMGISEIPNSVITLGLLEEFGQFITDEEDAEPLYELFEWLEGKGKPMAPSENPYDYEMVQLLGSCAIQAPMAFLRYHLLQEIDGETLEKMGLYKVIKAQTLKILVRQNLLHVQAENVQKECQKRLIEIGLQEAIWDLANEPEKWEAIMVDLEGRLKKIGLSSLSGDSTVSNNAERFSVSARQFLLEKALRLLSEHPMALDDLNIKELLPFVQFLVEKKKRREDYIVSQLNSHRKKGNLEALKNDLFRFTMAKGGVVKWLEEDFRANPDFWNGLKLKKRGRALYKEAKNIAPHLFSQ